MSRPPPQGGPLSGRQPPPIPPSASRPAGASIISGTPTNHTPPVDTGDRTLQAGQAIHFNATASYQVLKGLYIGANGYYLKQITDARANGIDLPNSRQQIGGIGPGAVYNRGK